jgi:hypothetical protein
MASVDKADEQKKHRQDAPVQKIPTFNRGICAGTERRPVCLQSALQVVTVRTFGHVFV